MYDLPRLNAGDLEALRAFELENRSTARTGRSGLVASPVAGIYHGSIVVPRSRDIVSTQRGLDQVSVTKRNVESETQSRAEEDTAAHRPLMNAPLRELRERRGVSQTQFAATISTSQPNVARIESEVDVKLSTMERYVRGLGGHIEVKAVFPNETVTLLPRPDQEILMSSPPIVSFRQALGELRPEDEMAVADEIAAWAIKQGLIPSYEPRKRELRFRSSRPGRRVVFSLLALGDLLIQLRWLLHAEAFKGAVDATELKDRLQSNVSGWKRRPANDGFPNLPLARLKDPVVRDALLGELAWVVERL